MAAEIIDCVQGEPDWYMARLGIPTASEFATVMAKGRGNAESKTRRTYMMKLLGERLTGEPMESYSNHHMERGKAMEPEARGMYAFMQDVVPVEVGFIRRGDAGCSPDSLVADAGMLEIKTKLPHLQVECLLANKLPPEHKAQCQGAMWVAEREWLDFVSYWPTLPLFVHRVYRDEEYIKTLSEAVDAFLEEMAQLEQQLRSLAA